MRAVRLACWSCLALLAAGGLYAIFLAATDNFHAVIPGLLDDLADDTRNVLLTLARVVLTLETGAIEPKDVAAERAASWLPAGPAATLRRARDGYLGVAPDAWAGTEAQADARAAANALSARIDVLGSSSR